MTPRAATLNHKATGPDDMRARLLVEAAKLFRVNGYPGASTRELASSLGIQKASLYHYIKTKEDLLFEVCREGWVRLEQAVAAAVDDVPDPLTALDAALKAHLETTITSRDFYVTMLSDTKFLPKRRQKVMNELRDKYWARMRSLAADAQAAHGLRSDVPAEQLVLVLRNILAWTAFWYRPEGELSLDELHRLFMRIFMEGAAA